MSMTYNNDHGSHGDTLTVDEKMQLFTAEVAT